MGASTGEMDGGTGAFHCTIQIEVLSFGLASQRLPGESEMALLQNQKRRRRSSPKIPLTGRTVVRDRMTGRNFHALTCIVFTSQQFLLRCPMRVLIVIVLMAGFLVAQEPQQSAAPALSQGPHSDAHQLTIPAGTKIPIA